MFISIPDELFDRLAKVAKSTCRTPTREAVCRLTDLLDLLDHQEGRAATAAPPPPPERAIKYIVVGRLPFGRRTFLDTPEAAIEHAKAKVVEGGPPLLVAEVISVIEVSPPPPPAPPPILVRAPVESDFVHS